MYRRRYPGPGRPKTSDRLINLHTMIEEKAKVKMERDRGSLTGGQYLTRLIEDAGDEMRKIAQLASEINEYKKILPELREKIAVYENNATESDRATEELRLGTWKEIRGNWKRKFDWKGFRGIELDIIQNQLKTRNKRETTEWVTPKLKELQEELEREYEQLREKEKQQPLDKNEWWFLHKKQILEAYQKGTPEHSPIYNEAEKKSGYRWRDIEKYCRIGVYEPWTQEELEQMEINEKYQIKADKWSKILNLLRKSELKLDEISEGMAEKAGFTKKELVGKYQDIRKYDLWSKIKREKTPIDDIGEEDLKDTGMTKEQFKMWYEQFTVQ